MVTQVLIIHGQLRFAITLKQMLERGAPFEAHPFTSVETALDYLQDHVQDVALIDFALPEMRGDEIVEHLRAIQPDIAVIATPAISDEQMEALGVLGSVDSGFNASDLSQMIDTYFAHRQRPTFTPASSGATNALSRPERTERPERMERATPRPPEDLPESSSFALEVNDSPGDFDAMWGGETPKPSGAFDEVLSALPAGGNDAPADAQPDPFNDLVNSMRSEAAHRPLPSRQQQFVEFILNTGSEPVLEETPMINQGAPPSLFERLAQEEPPMPRFEESGTVSDLISGVHEKSFRNVLSILRGDEVTEESESASQAIAAAMAGENFDFGAGLDLEAEVLRLVDSFDEVDSDQPTPAKVILQRTLEQSVAGGEFSLEELLANIERQLPLHRPRVLPLPSWLREQRGDDPFVVHEPEFLADVVAPDESDFPAGAPGDLPEVPAVFDSSTGDDMSPYQTTQAARGQHIESQPEKLETEWIDQPPHSAGDTLVYPDSLPEEIPAAPTVPHQYARTYERPEPPEPPDQSEAIGSGGTSRLWYDLPEQDFNTQFELMAAFEVEAENGVTSGALYAEMPVDGQADTPSADSAPLEDPYIAQLALSLTEVSLELTAEATLLARAGKIVAFAGQMLPEELEEVRTIIADDWEAAAGEVKIRFMTAQSSGMDYMIYSRRTEDDLTLSLIFAGATPLRDIRRQGKRLVQALLEVPEASEVTMPHAAAPANAPLTAPPAIEPVDLSALTPYALVWLLRDPHAALDDAVARAITAGLQLQLRERQWHVERLVIQEDHVYLLAAVPGEAPAYEIIRDLKRRSAEIAHSQNPAYEPDSLWADGYLVVTPGRELDVEEIQQFINFERMG